MTDWTADKIVQLIKKKYASPANSFNRTVVLTEVPNATGGFLQRWIDVAVFEMWPSKGLSRSAFEIKVSRSDFFNELRQPEKHQWCKDCFHYFWFVAPLDVIQEGELPSNAGWMYPAGERLCVKRHAVRNDSPRLDDKLLAGFMRAADKGISTAREVAISDALSQSSDYKHALEYQKAVHHFLSNCSADLPRKSDEDTIFQSLINARMDKKLEADRAHLDVKLHQFESTIGNLLDMVLLIASKSILARDELGHHLYDTPDKDVYLSKHAKERHDDLRRLLAILDEELKK